MDSFFQIIITSSLNSTITNNNGVATSIYTGSDAGDLTVKTTYGTVESNTIIIEDCLSIEKFNNLDNWTKLQTSNITATVNDGILTYTTTATGEKDLIFNTPLSKGYELTYTYKGGGGTQILGNLLIDSFTASLQYYYWGYDTRWAGRKQPNNASFTSQESQPVAGDTIRIISTADGAIKLYCNDNLIIEGITVYEKLYFGLYTNQNRLQKISNLKIKKVS